MLNLSIDKRKWRVLSDIKKPHILDIKISLNSNCWYKKIIFWCQKIIYVFLISNFFVLYQKIGLTKLTNNLMNAPCDTTLIFPPVICCGSVMLHFVIVAYHDALLLTTKFQILPYCQWWALHYPLRCELNSVDREEAQGFEENDGHSILYRRTVSTFSPRQSGKYTKD